MRLQRSISRRIGGREYVKHQAVIPNNMVEQLGWSSGDCLEGRITAKGLLIHKAEPNPKIKRPDYARFKEAVINILTATPQGCTWSELRLKAGLQQMTPSPIWVRRMEEENRLERIRDQVTSQVIWKLSQECFTPTRPSTLNSWTQKTSGSE